MIGKPRRFILSHLRLKEYVKDITLHCWADNLALRFQHAPSNIEFLYLDVKLLEIAYTQLIEEFLSQQFGILEAEIEDEFGIVEAYVAIEGGRDHVAALFQDKLAQLGELIDA